MSYSWNQRNKCPNCGGFAGAWKESLRCRGFRHRESGYFCEQDNGTKRLNFSGYDLFFYDDKEEE